MSDFQDGRFMDKTAILKYFILLSIYDQIVPFANNACTGFSVLVGFK